MLGLPRFVIQTKKFFLRSPDIPVKRMKRCVRSYVFLCCHAKKNCFLSSPDILVKRIAVCKVSYHIFNTSTCNCDNVLCCKKEIKFWKATLFGCKYHEKTKSRICFVCSTKPWHSESIKLRKLVTA